MQRNKMPVTNREVIQKNTITEQPVIMTWAQKATLLSKQQTALVEQEKEVSDKLVGYVNIITGILKKLEILDQSVNKWINAVKNYKNGPISKFLEVARPIGEEINDNWMDLLTARDEQNESEFSESPSADKCLAIQAQILKMESELNQLSINAPMEYKEHAEQIKTHHARLLKNINICIEKINELKPQGLRLTAYFSDPDAFIANYGEEIDELNAQFDALAEVENKQQQSILDSFSKKINALRIEDNAFKIIKKLEDKSSLASSKTPSITDSPVSSNIKSPSDSDEDGYASAFSKSSNSESKHDSSPSTSPDRSLSFGSLSKSPTQVMFKTAETQKPSGVSAAPTVGKAVTSITPAVTPATTAPAATVRR